MRKKHSTYLCEGCYRFVLIEEGSKRECPLCHTRLKAANKNITLTKLKQRVWHEFSDYIRLKKCLDTTRRPYKGVCYTCGKTFPTSRLQAGHLVSGRTDNVLFSEDCVELQCFGCNVCQHGRQADFIFHKIKDYQKEGHSLDSAYKKVQSLFHKKKKTYTKDQLARLLKKYREAKKNLERK